MVSRLHKEDICIRETKAAYVLLKDVSKSFNGIKALSDLTLEVKEGEFFSLLGPSGCGKTTALRLIAGLERPDKGTIAIGENIVAGERWISPEKREVGIVFQDYALFPHMTVFKNIAFGLRGCSRQDLKQKVMELLEIVGLSKMEERYPHELSGGQQQRVALARSLAPSPRVMLLDEPFSNLDADLRLELRTETSRILKERMTTTILVTHDQEEAFSLSDRVGVLYNGRLEQVGAPNEIYHKPLSRFVAGFVGRADFVSGRIKGGSIISDIGIIEFKGEAPGGFTEVDLMIRPDDVDFIMEPKGDAAIIDSHYLGAEIIYKLLLPDGKIIHSIKPSTENIPVGSKVKIKVDLTHVVVFPATHRLLAPQNPS
ncbi:MAG: ABC transporter ATP-binding protein [Nitrospirota bacterium]